MSVMSISGVSHQLNSPLGVGIDVGHSPKHTCGHSGTSVLTFDEPCPSELSKDQDMSPVTVYYMPPVDEPLNVVLLRPFFVILFTPDQIKGVSWLFFSTSSSVVCTARNPRVDVSTSCISATGGWFVLF